MGKLVGKEQYRDILLGAGLLWAALALVRSRPWRPCGTGWTCAAT